MLNYELRVASSLPAGADCLVPTAGCRLRLRGVGVGGTLGPYRKLRQDVIVDRERKKQ